MLKQRFFQALAIGFLVLYLGVAYAGWFALESLSTYAEYSFELIFVVVVLALYPKWEWKKAPFSLGAAVALFFALASGFAVYEFTGVLHYTIPFNLKDPETVVYLLLIGPLLEELVFRGALWKLVEVITRSGTAALIVTSVLFAYAHYYYISSVSPELANFIRYQAIYTLGLGLFCGGMRVQLGWRAAWFTHFAFNLGFWLGVGAF